MNKGNLLRSILGGILFLPLMVLANSFCPCPGPCCPAQYSDYNAQNAHSFAQITTYLSPYTSQQKVEEHMERDLQKHRLKENATEK